MDLYGLIREEKIIDYGRKYENWMGLIVNQYSDRTHFIFELLQNAEDEKASKVELRLFKDRLELEHDGVLFDENDIRSITSVAESTKNTSNKKGKGGIGKFGIGFKSVYSYTSTPKIFSGRYSFMIEKCILPYEIDPLKGLGKDKTCIVIPFNNPKVNQEKAYLEIKNALINNINPESILILNNIEEINIIIEDHKETVSLHKYDRQRDRYGRVYDISISLNKVNKMSRVSKEEEYSYLLFTDALEEPVAIVYKLKDNKLQAAPNNCFYTFFPTAKESHQNFYIHAPFNTTPARDNIVEDDERNHILVKNINDVINHSIIWLRDNDYLSLEGLSRIFPIYRYQENTLFYKIYKNSVDMLVRGEKILPTNNNSFKSLDELCVPANMKIVDLFTDDDLKVLFDNHRVFWLDREITLSVNQGIKKFLDDNFNLRTYQWSDLVSKITAAYLKTKEKNWFVRLFENIELHCVKKIDGYSGGHIDVSRIPFVRLKNGDHIRAFEDSKPLVYLNNPENCKNRILHDFIKDSVIKGFYARVLGIPEYDVRRIVIDEILPKYNDVNKVIFKSNNPIQENIEDLKLIKDAIYVSPEIAEEVKKKYIVTDGHNWYKPEDIHISNEISDRDIPEYSLLKGISKIRFLSNDYSNELKLDEAFFVKIGCIKSLGILEVTKDEYLNLVKRYIGTKERDELYNKIFRKRYIHGFDWTFNYEGFPEILNNLDKRKSIILARFLNKNSIRFALKGEVVGAEDQSFAGSNVHSSTIYSTLGLFISFLPWIYTKEGRKVIVTEIYRSEIDPQYEKECKRLMDMLPFKEEDSAITQILSRVENPKEREALKQLLSDSGALSEYADAYEKAKLKKIRDEEKKNKSPEEILKEMSNKSSKNKTNSSDEMEIDAVNNPDRRVKKIEESFQKSLDYFTSVVGTLQYTYKINVSSEEKDFLKQQYDGHCQICNKVIEKFDGGNYFEAINVIKTNEMAQKFKGTIDEGWNSLSLCPNCAAEYRYGIKDISRFYEQVKSIPIIPGYREHIKIEISLQGERKFIRYTPKHFIALKTALEYFSNLNS